MIIVYGWSGTATRAAKEANHYDSHCHGGRSTIQLAVGFVASLARPGGNITGLTQPCRLDLSGKRLELLKEVHSTPLARRPSYRNSTPAGSADRFQKTTRAGGPGR